MIGILDFDGTLVDSYSCIPIFYEKIRERINLDEGFIDAMLLIEDIGDYFGIFEREKFAKLIFKDTEDFVNEYWKWRKENTHILPGTIEFLEKYKDKIDLYLLTSKDDTKEIKLERIKYTGLNKYFKDIVIYGTDEFKNIREGLEYIKDIDKVLFYIDDKNTNLFNIRDIINVSLFKKVFYPPFPLRLAWRYPKINFPKIINLLELERYIKLE